MKKYAMSPGVPVPTIPNVIEYYEKSGWDFESVLYVGAARSAIAVPGDPSIMPIACILMSMETELGFNDTVTLPDLPKDGKL